jgi:hypothetical protein
MTAKFQLVIDCADPEPLARFWVAALGCQFEPPPDGYDNWDHYWRAVGVSEDELGLGLDCIVDPAGRGPPPARPPSAPAWPPPRWPAAPTTCLRREAPCHIPGSAGRNSEGGFWV